MKTEQLLVKYITKARLSGIKINVSTDEYSFLARNYAEMLNKFSPIQIKTALDKIYLSSSEFPSDAQIADQIKSNMCRVGADDMSRNALPAVKGITFTEYLWNFPDSYKKSFCASPVVRTWRKNFLLKLLKTDGIDPYTGGKRQIEDIQFELGLINDTETQQQ